MKRGLEGARGARGRRAIGVVRARGGSEGKKGRGKGQRGGGN